MSSRAKARSAKAQPGKARPVVRHDLPEVGARIAWTYLCCVISLVVAALVALIANPIIDSTACRVADAEVALSCRFAWVVIVVVVATLGGFAALARVFRLDVWVWLALVAGVFGWSIVGQIDQWWWWVVLLLVPAVAAAASAEWTKSDRSRQIHHLALIVAAVAAVTTAVIWFTVASG